MTYTLTVHTVIDLLDGVDVVTNEKPFLVSEYVVDEVY